ncbi:MULTISPECIES: ABC transporter ATP-binding protein [Aerococcus]|uniref:ABC transporter ATP-binding protein n=1 Tax=Aerococcus TaxID=1375 RepID=UPI0018A72995|nr:MULTISPECIES: ABC transporter ATP-binding protein [Aerococcus]MCY3035466.1 ABC transporter ATP-binding protein [Aerococcus sp. Group 2]MCY3038888.1 ABC transporter ATP-binding protein [Aerococcus sp. Group 2]MCY3041043.1 ABC transporter ATP-binding protein [Aerococcus sp. Group 2]MCY3042281.1 ABC transporter ATP-binding protein [Aerococcus sp. Group 2]MDK6520398.1 ABC transporter ATP-binding protein [Aerococcus urinae]
MEEVLRVDQLTKTYGKQVALDQVSLSLKAGEIYGLIGRNGAGKTTLLKAIVRLIKPSSGKVSLFHSGSSREWTKALERTGAVIESPVAYDALTAEQNLHYYCKLRGVVDEDRVVKETLDLVGLSQDRKKAYKSFSMGMKQKLGIGIALLTQPDLLILDEPINGLDPIAISHFRQLVKRLSQEKQMTIIISSHILSELYQTASRFGFINQGRLIQEMTKEEFEQMNREYIVLQTSQVPQASRLLSEQGQSNFKVVNEETIHIFSSDQKIQPYMKLFSQADVPIDAIYFSHKNLEDYFTGIVEEKGDQ